MAFRQLALKMCAEKQCEQVYVGKHRLMLLNATENTNNFFMPLDSN